MFPPHYMPHCITIGRQYDKDGRERMWWTEKAVETFNNRAQCFTDQYSNYEMFGISVSSLECNSSFYPARYIMFCITRLKCVPNTFTRSHIVMYVKEL